MADTTKLASMFKAWRVTLAMKPHNLEAVLLRCEELGLQPKPCGYQKGDGVLVQVVVPCSLCNHPDIKGGPMENEIFSLGAHVVHGVKVDLICPPSPEKPKLFKIGDQEGFCPQCSRYHNVIPALEVNESTGKEEEVFILVRHLDCCKTFCKGSGSKAIQHDGT